MTKTVQVSGGSKGIGRATALLMAQQGWQTAFTYRSDAEAAEVTRQEVAAAGGKALAIHGDTSQEADVIAAFDETTARLRQMFDTNVLGAFLFAREAARRLPLHRTTEGGAIVVVSSAAARIGSPFEYVDYAASKGAMDTLTLGLSKELAGQNIRVNAVRPGLIETDIHASGGQPDRAQRLGQAVPMARPGTAQEVAEAIAWLCSDAASYCTGSILDVAGGR